MIGLHSIMMIIACQLYFRKKQNCLVFDYNAISFWNIRSSDRRLYTRQYDASVAS